MNRRDYFILLVQTMCICEREEPMTLGDALLVLGDAMEVWFDALPTNRKIADLAAEWWGWRRNNAPQPDWLVEWKENVEANRAKCDADTLKAIAEIQAGTHSSCR